MISLPYQALIEYPMAQRSQVTNLPKPSEFVQSLSGFFKRDLISLPLIRKHPHQSVTQRCGLKAATLELDTAAFPNIDYIAGDRLSIYPTNPTDHVSSIMAHLFDDLQTQPAANGPAAAQARKVVKISETWAKFLQVNGRDSLKLALLHLYDIMTAPSRDLLHLMADCCTNKDHAARLRVISKSDESWEKWVSQGLRTLKSTLDEFNSCKRMSAKTLFSHLTLQQPRQYSISSIKSSKRFRTEIVVIQHKFTLKHIMRSLQSMKEQELNDKSKSGRATSPGGSIGPLQTHPTTVHVNHHETESEHSTSARSLRSMWSFATSPLTAQQVKRIPPYAGPLMSMYATSSLNAPSPSRTTSGSRISHSSSRSKLPAVQTQADNAAVSSASIEKGFDGLCSTYLLNLNPNEHIVCEFVENPRFTLKGNRERPIMMIGQDIGVVAFRPFWQQRSFEHDRAQVFYTMFKDLAAKKFGDMQLVCLTGSKCKIEDLFKQELKSVVANKILSSVSYINRGHLLNILDSAAATANNFSLATKISMEPKELADLGSRIAKLIVDHNGCLYTCCDPQMTQAIEILTIESIARSGALSREKAMELLPKWKGRKARERSLKSDGFVFTLENPFEKAQIVEEIYDTTI